MPTPPFVDHALAELLDEQPRLTLEDLARTCCMRPDWVVERLEAGLLQGEQAGGHLLLDQRHAQPA